MNSRFNENIVKLLTLSATVDPRNNYKLLNVDHICELATRFYPNDLTEQERIHLRVQAHHYELDVLNIPNKNTYQQFLSYAKN